MEQGKVFISSVLNLEVEDLRKERDTAREVVESYRFLSPWAFEKTPASTDELDESYLKEVDECDLFVLIVGTGSTNPVTAELLRAKKQGKPLLLFAKSVENRTPHAQSLLQLAGKKYAPFGTLEELRQAVQDAIDLALVVGLGALPSKTSGGSILGRLQQLIEKKVVVQIKPAIPQRTESQEFQVQEVNSDSVLVEKLSSGHRIHIPIGRVAEILVLAPGEPPVVQLDGRLQWLTISDSWKFFDLKPDPASPYGFHKPSHLQDVCAFDIGEALKKRGGRMGWQLERDLPGSLVRGVEIVYDDDGKYFRTPSRPSDLIYVWIRN